MKPSSDASRWRVDYHLWCTGGRLRPYSREVRALSEADAVSVARRLERAAAHASGHRDISSFHGASAERLNEVGS